MSNTVEHKWEVFSAFDTDRISKDESIILWSRKGNGQKIADLLNQYESQIEELKKERDYFEKLTEVYQNLASNNQKEKS